MQEIWTTGIKWDDHLPESLNNKWEKYKSEMNEIKNIKIQRWVNTNKNTDNELHGFADASEYAYAAAVYCRTIDKTGHITTQLLMAKTRVAPNKTKLSIPRLELTAALLLAKLMKHVYTAMKFAECRTYAWTDSTIVLCWIKGDPNRFKTFVANRISTIWQIIPTTEWHHVRSQDNPTDVASRGSTPLELANNRLWWEGPHFLRQNSATSQTVHAFSHTYTHQDKDLELKTVKIMTTNKSEQVFKELFERCSNYNKLKRIVAYYKRFIDNTKSKTKNGNQPTGSELKNAELIILKSVQSQDFWREINCLSRGEKINNKSKILSLNPTLDEQGLLRLNGRLQNSTLPSSCKNPIILDKNNIVTQRIIEDAHVSTLHGGAQLTLSHIRNKHWIIDGKRAVRQVINKCITCFRHKRHAPEQKMGILPSARVRPGRAFAKTGIDYAGPIQLRTTRGRGHKAYKGYIALFICMVTKAIHIEIVSDLTTDSFIAAYKRFTSRRGLCRYILR